MIELTNIQKMLIAALEKAGMESLSAQIYATKDRDTARLTLDAARSGAISYDTGLSILHETSLHTG